MVRYRIVNIGRDYPGKITDFSQARNSFLEQLGDDEYILFLDSDEEAPRMLLDHISLLQPRYPYYDIRRINLVDDMYAQLQNPFFKGCLVSNRVRFRGKVHEKPRPREPHGRIDIPIIHNHRGPTTYTRYNPSRILLMARKFYEILRYGF